MENPAEMKHVSEEEGKRPGCGCGEGVSHHSVRQKNRSKGSFHVVSRHCRDFKWPNVKTWHLRRSNHDDEARCCVQCWRGAEEPVLGILPPLPRALASGWYRCELRVTAQSDCPSAVCVPRTLSPCLGRQSPSAPMYLFVLPLFLIPPQPFFLETIVYNSSWLSCVQSDSQCLTTISVPRQPTGTASVEISGPDSRVWTAMLREFITCLVGPLLPRCLPPHVHSHLNPSSSLPSLIFQPAPWGPWDTTLCTPCSSSLTRLTSYSVNYGIGLATWDGMSGSMGTAHYALPYSGIRY